MDWEKDRYELHIKCLMPLKLEHQIAWRVALGLYFMECSPHVKHTYETVTPRGSKKIIHETILEKVKGTI